MDNFIAKAVTPDGEKYNGKVQMVSLRTLNGEIGIFAHHTDYMGVVEGCIVKLVDNNGVDLFAVAGGGFITVDKGEFTLVTDYFVFADDIDKVELEKSKLEVQSKLEKCTDKREIAILRNKLKRIALKEKISGIN